MKLSFIPDRDAVFNERLSTGEDAAGGLGVNYGAWATGWDYDYTPAPEGGIPPYSFALTAGAIPKRILRRLSTPLLQEVTKH